MLCLDMLSLSAPFEKVIRSLTEDLINVNSMGQIQERFSRQIEKVGYHSFVYVRPPKQNEEARRFLRWSTWPSRMKKEWIDNRQIYNDPTVKFISSRSRPWFSHEILARMPNNKQMLDIIELRRYFDVPDFFCSKVSDFGGGKSYVIVEGRNIRQDETTRSFLWLASQQLDAAISHLVRSLAGVNKYDVTLREIDVVNDVLNGLEPVQGAKRMDVPIEQYRDHMRFVCEKCDVNSIKDAAQILDFGSSQHLNQSFKNLLTDREKYCLRLASFGMTDHKIAENLKLSHRTVSVHIANGLRKLGAKTRSHGVRIALQNDLI